ncbi:FkbM family methyltransferase [Bradyrhizobium sp. UBA2491]|uniref:FkbM family methyltransferase n=1 Tax=Bradyrhizobium sp. UBA2491 TaxID=1946119 RepID=UPI00046778E5|nr:FkbM family methyltransferase [Bradyrhizobium sp. UBA2491]KIU52580.1 hypothetical protein QU41_02675 [Bradyrhizobium elkanii]MBK5652366.1 FkbM family methyltransferase [Rhizobium sp.]OCX32686.1 hypothetical protein QU42_02780 [Bradyrhizobium sp. UASWS1016]
MSREFVLGLRDALGVRSFVETGTYLGDTLARLSGDFKSLQSIELSQDYHDRAVARFAGEPQVHLINADSTSGLETAIGRLKTCRAIIWLDAHYSGGDTAKGLLNTPVKSEIDAVLANPQRSDIILIDDLRCFWRTRPGFLQHEALEGYPSMRDLVEMLNGGTRQYDFFALSDALLAIPADLREHYTASPLLQALMQSRLGLTAETGLVAAERAIAAAAEPELSALLEIPDYLASQVEYGLAGHYYYWRALVRMERGEREAAQADAEIASSCGVIPNGSLLVQFMETQASRKTKESGSMSLVEQVKEIVANDPRVERDTGLIDAENSQSLVRSANSEYWRAIDGDHTLRLNYDLDNNSVVFDLGGYKGEWSEQISKRYMCRIFVFEPVPNFAEQIVERFRGNNNVSVYGFGLGPSDAILRLTLNDDATSSHSLSDGDVVEAEMKEFVAFLEQHDIRNIDLLKINIEGGEFELLDHLISTGCISRVRHLQVQFHNFVPDAKERMEHLRRQLWETHAPSYSLDWIWDSWTSEAVSESARGMLANGLRWHQQALRELSARAATEFASHARQIRELEALRQQWTEGEQKRAEDERKWAEQSVLWQQWAEDSRILNKWRRRLEPLLEMRNLIRRLSAKVSSH